MSISPGVTLSFGRYCESCGAPACAVTFEREGQPGRYYCAEHAPFTAGDRLHRAALEVKVARYEAALLAVRQLAHRGMTEHVEGGVLGPIRDRCDAAIWQREGDGDGDGL